MVLLVIEICNGGLPFWRFSSCGPLWSFGTYLVFPFFSISVVFCCSLCEVQALLSLGCCQRSQQGSDFG